MKTDPEAMGKRDADKLIADTKSHPPVSKSSGKEAQKKRPKPSDMQFTNIIDKVNEGFVALDAQMNYIYINQRGSELLKRKPEELIGKNYWEEYPQDKDTSFGKAYLQALETQTPIQLEDHYGPGNRWFENRIYPSESGLSIFFNDITDRKRAEGQLRESEERFRNLSNIIPSIIWTAAPDGTILYANNHWYEYTGIAPQENSKDWPVVLHPDDYERCLSEWTHALETVPDEYLIEVRNRRYDGQYRWFQTRAIPARDSNGQATAWYGVTTDIHNRIEAENALLKSEKQLQQVAAFDQAIMDNMGEGLYTVDRAGAVTSMNPAAEKMFGWTFNELRGRKMHDATHYKHPDGTPFPSEDCAGFQVLHHGENLVGYEDVFIRKDDTFFDVIYSSSPLWENGQIHGLVVVFNDNTTRKQAEKRLVLLSEISELVRTFEEPNELLFAVSKAVGDHLQVRRCLFNEIDVENDIEIVHRDYCRDVESVAGVHKISDYSSVTSAEMAAGKTVVNYDSKTDPRTAPDYERSYVPHGARAYMTVPLMRENRWVASLWVSDDKPRDWSTEEVSLLETVAERTWTAIEKLRINSALRASEELYRVIARSIPGGGVYVVDKEFRYRVAEGPVTEAFGLARARLEGHTVSEVFPPEPSARMEERLRKNFAGETMSYETNHNGRVYWTQQAPLLDSIGQAIVITMDITERKQAEEALLQSEERFAQFMQHLPGLAWIKDLQGSYVYANAAAERAFNASGENLYGRTDQDIFPPDIAAQFMKNDQQALADGKGIQVIETLRHDDGVLHYSLVSKFPIPGPDGNPALIGGTAFDITERKQAEEALEESRERNRNLFDLVPVAVYACDSNGLIQEFNHSAVELWGREPQKNDPKEKFCGSFRIYYPDSRPMPHEECPMARILNGETLEPHELEILLERTDGVRRNVIAHPLPLKNEHGEIVSAINCLYDITERKQAEEALQQLNLELESRVEKRTAQLQAANQALDESHKRLQSLSQRLVEVQEEERRAIARELHDRVGQSLAALNLNLTIINNQLSSRVNEQVNARLSDSLDLVADLIALVRDVMSNLRPAVLDDYGLEAALQTNLESFKSRYGIGIAFEKNQSPIPRLTPSLEMTILRIAQEALPNVVRHAQADQIAVSVHMVGQAIRLTVQDNGIGIQSWQSANRPGSHGLTIMRERAEAVGGNLKVSSTPGKGTRIEARIPFQGKPPKEEHR